MNIIREVFDQTRPIDRQITSVINYAGATEDQLEREIREYEVTDSLARHYERLLNNLADGFAAALPVLRLLASLVATPAAPGA